MSNTITVVSKNPINEKMDIFVIIPPQPSPKRARQETSTEEYSRYIQTAECALKGLQALTEDKAKTSESPPQWLESRLQELQTLINHIRAASQTS